MGLLKKETTKGPEVLLHFLKNLFHFFLFPIASSGYLAEEPPQVAGLERCRGGADRWKAATFVFLLNSVSFFLVWLGQVGLGLVGLVCFGLVWVCWLGGCRLVGRLCGLVVFPEV